MKPFIYLRALRYVEHTVFSVADGQKFYKDPLFGRRIAYSSGQQVKRSVLDSMTGNLNVAFAPVTFNWTIEKDAAKQGEAWSVCDPSFPDQLIGGFMKAEKGAGTVKRRSPLSISAMRPLHPLLGGIELENEGGSGERRQRNGEPMSFDRADRADKQKVNVYMMNGDKRELMSEHEVENWLKSKNDRTLPPKKWLDPQQRASGLYVYDIAIDLRTLFCVSTNQLEPEVSVETLEKLKSEEWVEGENVFGKCLICPAPERKKIIEALADALLSWRITSNQARTFSLMDTLAVAICDNANQVAYAIRAELDGEASYDKAYPIIDESSKANLFLSPTVSGYIKGTAGSSTALEDAAKYLEEQIGSFDFEHQMSS